MQQNRFMSALEDFPSAKSAWEKSCYFEMDFTINEDASVYEAIQKFAAYDVGCLVTTDAKGKLFQVQAGLMKFINDVNAIKAYPELF